MLKWHGTHDTLLEYQFATHDMLKEKVSLFRGYVTFLTEDLLCSLTFSDDPGMKVFTELVKILSARLQPAPNEHMA
jgi:hypothetical protein